MVALAATIVLAIFGFASPLEVGACDPANINLIIIHYNHNVMIGLIPTTTIGYWYRVECILGHICSNLF
jgi:hypothetical protein